MKKTDKILRTVMFCGLAATGLTLVGCSTNDDIDVSDVDTTVGVKLDKFTVPLGKTDDISIDDVLELKEGDCIRIKTNGDYEFYKDGNEVKGADDIKIDPIKYEIDNSKTNNNFTVSFNVPAIPNITVASTIGNIQRHQNLKTFSFSGSKDEAVLELKHVSAAADVKIRLNTSGLKGANVNYIHEAIFTLPPYMKTTLVRGTEGLADGSGLVGNILTLKRIPTSTTERVIELQMSALEGFIKNPSEAADLANYLLFNNGTHALNGSVDVDLTINPNDITLPRTSAGDVSFTAAVELDPIITVTEATGKFNPSINIDDFGDITIGDNIPSFLTDNAVDLKLSNPCITLSLDNDVDAQGIINATMTAIYKDNTTKSINLKGASQLVVDPHKGATGSTKTTFYICRNAEGAPAGVKTIVKDGNDGDTDIADLLQNIPDKITFTCHAEADPTYEGTIKLGTLYNIKPAYSFSAPLSLDPGSTIVYDDKVDDFYKDIEDNDIDFRNNATLEITGKVTNNTPLKLVLESTAVDVNGNPINGIKLENSNEIKSNLDGSAPTNLVIKLTKDATVKSLKDVKFNGITFKAKATSDKAETLNKEKHTIKIEDLKISISGEVSIDTDKK